MTNLQGVANLINKKLFGNRVKMIMRKKTREEYVNELKKKNPNIELIGDYIDANTKTMHHCKIHNVNWETTPSRALSGVGCNLCHNEKLSASKYMTNEEYIEKLKNVNPRIISVDDYAGEKTPILHKCLKHNVVWKVLPENVLKGCGCKECGNEKVKEKNKKTHSQYIKELKEKNDKIIVIDQYINSLTPILHKCLVDGYEWRVAPAGLLSGKGCPKCSGNMKYTQDEYIKKVFEINPNIEVIGEYMNAKTPILHKCNLDGNIWKAEPSSILSGCGCPKCNRSHGENEIARWLEKHNIQFESQKKFNGCRDKNLLPFDFFLPDYNTAIEYDGKQHFQPIDYFGGKENYEKLCKHDNIKDDYCAKNNIRLLRIPYTKDIGTELNNFLFI